MMLEVRYFYLRKLTFVAIFWSLEYLVAGDSITVPNCGISTVDSGRIVGGKGAVHGDYPFMVSVHDKIIYQGVTFEHGCGGAILNERWIVTAAHCLESTDTDDYEVHAGIHRLSNKEIVTAQKVKISKIVIHEQYSYDADENDIALLKTDKPLDIEGSNGYINGICLPTSTQDPTGNAKVTGWGIVHENGIKNSDILKVVTVPMVTRDRCNQFYGGRLTSTMICAGSNGKDSCQNDSGGPLFQTNSEGVSTLIGIVSFGSGCGSGYPGVYTKVSSYLDWIKKNVSK